MRRMNLWGSSTVRTTSAGCQKSKATSQPEAFKAYPIGFFHIDIAEVQTAQGKLYLFVAMDRTSTFAFAELAEKQIV